MSQQAIELFLGRLITDEYFRESAKKSLEKTCMANGFAFSEKEMRILQKIDFDRFSVTAACLDKDILRASKVRDECSVLKGVSNGAQ